jgi:hypothetical protein
MDGANMNAQVGLCSRADMAPISAISISTKHSASRMVEEAPAWGRFA